MDKLIPLTKLRLKYLKKVEEITIDGFVFSLHYRFTFILFLAFGLLITYTQFFGDPIKCLKGDGGKGESVPEKLLNNYCWIEGTFTLPKALIKAIDRDVPAPGVEQFYGYEKDEVIEHSYYQWVSTVLFIQGVCFYITRMLWKAWESGKMKHLMNELNKAVIEDKKKKEKMDILVKYFLANRGRHSAYAFRYFICEGINFVHVIVQMIIINWFLGGQFSSYGLDVLKYVDVDAEKRPDPMAKIFPKLTKCTFFRFGPSGDVMRYDNLCLLPLNILNEKAYIFIWFWLYILSILSGLMVLYRIVIIAFPRMRFLMLQKLHSLVPERYIDMILSRCGYGDWFLLYLLGKNLDTMHYRDIIIQIGNQLEVISDDGDEMDNADESRV